MSMKSSRWLLVAMLAAVVVIASLLAHALPTDSTWLAGVTDGSDYDDIVNFITSGAVATQRVDGARLTPVDVTRSIPPSPPAAPSTRILAPYRLRAPTLS